MKVKRYSFHFKICLQQNVQKIFYLKKSLTEQDKKFILPFALEGIFVYLYRETEYYSNWTCWWEIRGEWLWRLLYGCSLRLLCVWRKGWKSCKDCWAEFFATLKLATNYMWRQNSATFSRLGRRRRRRTLNTDRVSVSQNKSNVATPETGFR